MEKFRTLISKLDRKINRLKLRLSPNRRPASDHYISGDGFRQLAQHLYDETQKCRPSEIKAGEIVFLKTDFLEEYFTTVHPQIKFAYKLITHNSDCNITERELKYLDDKIIHWYAQNVLVKHPRLTPIPIGLENEHYYFNGIPKLFDKIKKIKITKKPRILFGFSISTNKLERQEALNNLESSSSADKIENFPLPSQYLKLLNTYQFVASPHGHGLDCHRTWEALYLQTIPIVRRSVALEYFKQLGLPLLLINDWLELKNYNQECLAEIFEKLSHKSHNEPLTMSYWREIICAK